MGINSDPHNNGGNTDYYRLPDGATMIQDLIEWRNMNFAVGNIFKACYRLGEKSGQDVIRDLNKIIWFAEREKARLQKTPDRYTEVSSNVCGHCGSSMTVDISGMKTNEVKSFSCPLCGYGPHYFRKGIDQPD